MGKIQKGSLCYPSPSSPLSVWLPSEQEGRRMTVYTSPLWVIRAGFVRGGSVSIWRGKEGEGTHHSTLSPLLPLDRQSLAVHQSTEKENVFWLPQHAGRRRSAVLPKVGFANAFSNKFLEIIFDPLLVNSPPAQSVCWGSRFPFAIGKRRPFDRSDGESDHNCQSRGGRKRRKPHLSPPPPPKRPSCCDVLNRREGRGGDRNSPNKERTSK